MSTDRQDDDMIYGLTADEHEFLRRGLANLAEVGPPRSVWLRIREQAEAEGLLIAPRERWRRVGGLGLAAAVAIVAVLFGTRYFAAAPEFATEPAVADLTNAVELTALRALMVESQQLEQNLRALPDEPRVMRASTVATISDIEDRIAAIDYQLSDSDALMTPEEQQIFWRERVRLMKSLVRLRYAQAQRTAF